MNFPAKDQVISPCIFGGTHRSHLELSSGPHPESTTSSHTLQDMELPKLPRLAMRSFRTVLHPGSAALAGASLYVGVNLGSWLATSLVPSFGRSHWEPWNSPCACPISYFEPEVRGPGCEDKTSGTKSCQKTTLWGLSWDPLLSHVSGAGSYRRQKQGSMTWCKWGWGGVGWMRRWSSNKGRLFWPQN